VRPVRKRKLVDAVCGQWDVSIRRGCRVLEMDTSTYHYKTRRPGQAGLEPRIREICQTRVRFGYRRIHVQLRREGWPINEKKTRRIYRELGLQLRNKTPKRRVKAKLRDDRRPATRSNETWAMDFVHDQLATGQKLRVLTIIDTFSRFSPGAGASVHVPGCRRRRHLGEGRQRGRIAGNDPGRSRDRVCIPRFGSLGLPAWCHARLQSTGQANRQCFHRGFQRPVSG
jgi:transposase InsO family protein